MIFNPWKTAYVRTFHQLRTLSLLSLIFSHSLTFVNFSIQTPLESLAIFPFIRFFSPFGVFFVALAGVTFRLAVADDFKGLRLKRWPDSNVPIYLFILIAIDTLKNYWVYGTFIYIIHWDFLKTLLLAYFIIVLLARIHLAAVAALSVSMILGADAIRSQLKWGLISPAEITDELIRWNGLHFQALFLSLLILAAAAKFILTRDWPTRLKGLGFFSFGLLAFSPFFWSLTYRPTLDSYAQIHNWMINGILGDTKDSHLYSGLAWLPTVLNAFVISHFCLRLRSFFEENSQKVAITTFFIAVAAYFIYAPTLPSSATETLIWKLPAFSHVSLASEFFKAASIVNVFVLFTLMNRRWLRPPFENGTIHFSRASFLIYLLCTSLSTMIAPYCADNFGLALGASVNISVTLLAAILVSETAAWVSRKKISFQLIKAPLHTG